MHAASRGHHFLSIQKNGQVAIVETRGNTDCHVILREAKPLTTTHNRCNKQLKQLDHAGVCSKVMIDFSHALTVEKQHLKQMTVGENVSNQIGTGNDRFSAS